MWVQISPTTFGISVGDRDDVKGSCHCGATQFTVIAFLAYCLHVTLQRRLHALAPGLTVRSALDRFGESITWVQVHLSDENGPRFAADDKRCMIEARVTHREPIAVSHRATDVHQAVSGAAGKLRRSIDQALDRQRSH